MLPRLVDIRSSTNHPALDVFLSAENRAAVRRQLADSRSPGVQKLLKILELRSKAQKELGQKFSLKQFHNAVLRAGTVPLSVLEEVVQGYIKANQ